MDTRRKSSFYHTYEKLGKTSDSTDDQLARLQKRIDKASANSKDVAALQSEPYTYKSPPVGACCPACENIKNIFNPH